MNPPATPGLTKNWRHGAAAVSLLLLWILFFYRETALSIVAIWSKSETFTHGFLVLPIVFWLVWRRRQLLMAQAPRSSVLSLLPVCVAALLWLLGELAAVNSVTQLALVAMLVLSVPVALGLPVTRVIVFPLAFLFFAVPIGEFFMPQLMEWTASFTVLALRFSGIPVYREGLQFVIPSGNWSVVEACSGVRYLIASLTVGTLFAYLNYQSTKRRLVFIAISILVPVVANWMRAYLIVMLGHLSGNKLAAGVDHLIYGWVFFGIVIMVMFMIGARWAEPEISSNATGSIQANAFSSVGAASSVGVLWSTAVAMALITALPYAAQLAIKGAGSGAMPVLAAPSTLAANWQGGGPSTTEWKPAFQNSSAQVNATYSEKERTVEMYLGYYREQDYSRKLVSSDNVVVKSQDPRWAQVSAGSHVVDVGRRKLPFRTIDLRGLPTAEQPGGTQLVVWQLYWVNGSITSSDYMAKAYSALYRLAGRGDDSAVILFYASKEQAGGAQAALEAFVRDNFETVDALLAKTRDNR